MRSADTCRLCWVICTNDEFVGLGGDCRKPFVEMDACAGRGESWQSDDSSLLPSCG